MQLRMVFLFPVTGPPQNVVEMHRRLLGKSDPLFLKLELLIGARVYLGLLGSGPSRSWS